MTPTQTRWTDRRDIELGIGPSRWHRITAPQLFVGSFLLLIAIGTLGLRTLPGIYTGDGLGWVDALFTATSAVCVTGLIVVDTATYFTPLGQAFLLLLIQLGGLGMIAFSTLIILTIGRRLSHRQEMLSASSVDVVPNVDVRRLSRDVVIFTFGIEAIGAILLFLMWMRPLGVTGAIWPAIFHAVSAFCNAGFSTFSNSLIGFQTAPATLLVIMSLIVLGGIGFLTLEELALQRRARRGQSAFRLSLHSRIVLAMTAILIVGGWLLFTLFEWSGSFAALPPWARFANGLFLSVTARTAGFNSIDYGTATESTNFLTIILMSIGGSPGSTAGGLKTTTIAIIGLLAWARFSGVTIPSVAGRSIPLETTQRAVGLFVIGFGTVTAAIFALTITESDSAAGARVGGTFLVHMFEAVSAFNTVGLSMGATAELTNAGRWITILLMYLGRVGPLTFAAAVALRASPWERKFRYAYEDVVVG